MLIIFFNTLLKDSIVILENILLFSGIISNFIHKYVSDYECLYDRCKNVHMRRALIIIP